MINKPIIWKQKVLFLKKLLVVIILLFIFDFIIGSLLQDLYSSQISGPHFGTTYSLEKTEAEIIILGSSRANHHYKPQIFADTFDLSCYNAGRNGQHILFQYAILKGILKRYNPKMVILDILPNQLLENPDHYDRLEALYPYYNDHEELRTIIESKSKMEKFKLLSKIYPYNSLLLSIIKNNKGAQNNDNGYIPLKKVMNSSKESEVLDNEDFNPIDNFDMYVIEALESFITESKNAGAKIYLIISPLYNYTGYPESLIKLEQIARKHNIVLLNYSDDQEFQTHPELFQDMSHLNDNGAELFSTIVSERIKQGSIDMSKN